MYDQQQKNLIITLARDAVAKALAHKKAIPPDDCPPFLLEDRGCFVTLNSKSGQLRGCIGSFDTTRPIINVIIEMAGAATRDPRFTANPVTLVELDDLNIEVSVLTPMQPITDPADLRIGIDGIYILDEQTQRSGCFLPQVAPEQNWNVEQTLSYCCSHKMGLSPDAWRPPNNLKFFIFQAAVIHEASPGIATNDEQP